MRFDIITIFPKAFAAIEQSIIGKAELSGYIDINIVDLRDYTCDKRRTVDDKPYGGGPGMLMKPEPVFKAVESLKSENSKVVLTSPAGRLFKQSTAEDFCRFEHIILICGHYEGVDHRIAEGIVDYEISIGDYILTNGNLPAMIIVDAVTRLLPGVLGSENSAENESFSLEKNRLEYPQYTRPENFREMKVPEILLSGNHKAIEKWRKEKSKEITESNRPDLIK